MMMTLMNERIEDDDLDDEDLDDNSSVILMKKK